MSSGAKRLECVRVRADFRSEIHAQTGTHLNSSSLIQRQRIDVDIVCVGFGPATAGFLTTLSKRILRSDGSTAIESGVMPGVPLQVVCYERADGAGFGVSGVVTRGWALKQSCPEIDGANIPMATPVTEEKVIYLLDPVGASRRPALFRVADALLRAGARLLPVRHHALEMPWTPTFLRKGGGIVLSLGQFMQWVGTQIIGLGAVQVWPGTPVSKVLIEDNNVVGVRLLDQGVDKLGHPADGFMAGMDVRAALTVVGDGPTGQVGRQLDEHFGMPPNHHNHDWAVGMKFVVDLPGDSQLRTGTVLHTIGFPEPEIFGFLYVHPDRVASIGIFVPSWFDNPVRTAYRYLQHWMQHPYIWRRLAGGSVRSWGAKTLGESGLQGEPHLVGNGYARIGEGSGSTNVLTGSGVDEAWATGVFLAEAVLELIESKKPFNRQNLADTYIRRRRTSWVEQEASAARHARDAFHRGVVRGMIGMALAGLTGGRLTLRGATLPPWKRIPTLEEYCRGRIAPDEVAALRNKCRTESTPLHDAVMDRLGWPAIQYDGKLLISHQDALLLGGKVQAPPGYADHVLFSHTELCAQCMTKVCIELCSGQAIVPGPGGVPAFDRDKCVHCGTCQWNCTTPVSGGLNRTNIAFEAGTGGLHSAEN